MSHQSFFLQDRIVKSCGDAQIERTWNIEYGDRPDRNRIAGNTTTADSKPAVRCALNTAIQ
jgi:hypothetical protein